MLPIAQSARPQCLRAVAGVQKRRNGSPTRQRCFGLTDDGLPPLRAVVAAFGIEPAKALGQNFLFDLNLTRRIARASGQLSDVRVLEVGPGPGGLTRALLAEGASVVAVERDRRCLAALALVAARYPGRLTVIEGDALDVVPTALPPGAPLRVVANLPYNIATALLTRWVETDPWPPWFDQLTLMFQREVAERIVATPNQRAAYGRLAVLCNWRCETRILFDVPASAFVPPPNVLSSVVSLVPRIRPDPCDPAVLSAITAAAFGQRRKMLRQALRGLATSGYGVDAGLLLSAAGIDGSRRAETLQIGEFAALSRTLCTMMRTPAAPAAQADDPQGLDR